MVSAVREQTFVIKGEIVVLNKHADVILKQVTLHGFELKLNWV